MRGYIVRWPLLLIPNIFIFVTKIIFLVRVTPDDAVQTLRSSRFSFRFWQSILLQEAVVEHV